MQNNFHETDEFNGGNSTLDDSQIEDEKTINLDEEGAENGEEDPDQAMINLFGTENLWKMAKNIQKISKKAGKIEKNCSFHYSFCYKNRKIVPLSVYKFSGKIDRNRLKISEFSAEKATKNWHFSSKNCSKIVMIFQWKYRKKSTKID